MRSFILLLMSMLMAFSPQGFSQPGTERPRNALAFEIVQDEFVFDHSTVDKAIIIERKDGSYGGLRIKLKPSAAPVLERATLIGMRKRANLIFNNQIISTAVIQSPLKDNLFIAGISKENAQHFIEELKRSKKLS